MIAGYISSPSSSGLHIGPLFVHMYGLMYVFAVAAVVLMTRSGAESVPERPSGSGTSAGT
jgi:prolipoprotein diacylglyceryltransferase